VKRRHGRQYPVVLIRPRTPDDMADPVELATTVRAIDHYPVHLSDEDLARFLTRPIPLAAWVAEFAGRPVGHVATNSRSNRPVMDVIQAAGITGDFVVPARLLVEPGVRRTGIATQLLEQAGVSIAALGRRPVLDVVVSSPAVDLYRSAGWRELGTATIRIPCRTVSEEVFASPD
jgi:GNAT superfamily N-acetyltransferase